jgi:hypothetical protein
MDVSDHDGDEDVDQPWLSNQRKAGIKAALLRRLVESREDCMRWCCDTRSLEVVKRQELEKERKR